VQIGVAEDPRRQRAAAIAQLERQVGTPARVSRRSLRVQAKTPSTASPARSVASAPARRAARVDGVIAA
jgi:hypothetical protein